MANIQDSLHYWMKNVQICFYHFAASDKAIMPRFRGHKNPAKDWKCILQKGIRKLTNYYLVTVRESFVYIRHSLWLGSCLFF